MSNTVKLYLDFLDKVCSNLITIKTPVIKLLKIYFKCFNKFLKFSILFRLPYFTSRSSNVL